MESEAQTYARRIFINEIKSRRWTMEEQYPESTAELQVLLPRQPVTMLSCGPQYTPNTGSHLNPRHRGRFRCSQSKGQRFSGSKRKGALNKGPSTIARDSQSVPKEFPQGCLKEPRKARARPQRYNSESIQGRWELVMSTRLGFAWPSLNIH